MSSFVINKASYIKCAGLFAALADCKDYYRDPVFRVWNKRTNNTYNAADIRADFERLYAINAAAVAEQYNDDTLAADSNDYRADFDRIYSEIKSRWNARDSLENRRVLKITFYGVIRFFQSVQYQIEGDEYARRALMIINKYYRGLYKAIQIVDNITNEDLSGYWGDFDIDE